MPTDRFYGDDVELTVEINSTTLTAGKARSITVEAVAEHVELLTPEDVSFIDVKRRDVAVQVDLEFVEFNEDIAQYWLQGDGSSTSTTINNDSNVAQFDITCEVDMTDHTGETGDESLKAVVNGVHYENMPLIDTTEGEYATKSLSGGRGNAVTFTKEQVS